MADEEKIIDGEEAKLSPDSSPEKAKEGESPTPEGEGEEKSLAEVVTEAAKGKEKGQDEVIEEEEPDKEEVTPEEEETELPPFHEHPRWKEVLAERNELKEKVEDLTQKASTADALAEYCQTNGISEEALYQALELTALAQKDVKEFRRRIGEFAENIDIEGGVSLPADLRRKVDDGVIDEETAKELAQTRVKLKQKEAVVATQSRSSADAAKRSIASALDNWEGSTRKADPGYDSRRPMIQDRLVALWAAKPPTTVEEAVSLAERANREVRERVAKLQPKPPKRKVLSSAGSSTNKGEEMKLDSLDDLGKLVRQVAYGNR